MISLKCLPYQCPQCPKSYYRKYQLQKHQQKKSHLILSEIIEPQIEVTNIEDKNQEVILIHPGSQQVFDREEDQKRGLESNSADQEKMADENQFSDYNNQAEGKLISLIRNNSSTVQEASPSKRTSIVRSSIGKRQRRENDIPNAENIFSTTDKNFNDCENKGQNSLYNIFKQLELEESVRKQSDSEDTEESPSKLATAAQQEQSTVSPFKRSGMSLFGSALNSSAINQDTTATTINNFKELQPSPLSGRACHVECIRTFTAQQTHIKQGSQSITTQATLNKWEERSSKCSHPLKTASFICLTVE
ncbi:hypothetical protein FGO68_gene373 [Halteria grandinella]|uniref:C2H2-type domain-containing protein n=1 Tax=Halteria grandinella TaxID=5974 RepID=A0A8J8P3V9_HALGN|nr:hypothetical protein FGO68_gene373 [Halteria grandinella]